MIKDNERGVALVSVITILSIILIMGSIVMYASFVDGLSANKYENDTEVYYVARSAASIVVAGLTTQKASNPEFFELVYNMTVGTSIASVNPDVAGGSANVTINRVSDTEFTVVSEGTINGVSKEVTAVLNFTPYPEPLPLFEYALFAKNSYDTQTAYIWGDVASNDVIQAGLNNVGTRICTLESYPTCTYVMDRDEHILNNMGREVESVTDEVIPVLENKGSYFGLIFNTLRDEGTYSSIGGFLYMNIDTSDADDGVFDIVVDGDMNIAACYIRISGPNPVNFFVKGDLNLAATIFSQSDDPSKIRFFVQGGDVDLSYINYFRAYIYAPDSTVTIDPIADPDRSLVSLQGSIVAETLDVRSTMYMRYIEPTFHGDNPLGLAPPPGGDFSVSYWR